MTVATRPPPAAAAAVRRNAPHRARRGQVEALVAIEAAALLVVVLAVGGGPWSAARAVLVAAVAGLAAAGARSRRRWLRALTGLLVGVVGVATGVALGLLHLLGGSVTVVSLAALAALVPGVLLWASAVTTTLRGRRGWPPRTAVAVGVVAALVFVQYPVTSAAVATNRVPTSVGVHTPADLGLEFEDVEVRASDGVRLSAWYVPSANGAAVVLRHGAGSTRAHLLEHAAVLADRGYGTLLMDARGHGDSAGTTMDLGWHGDRDVAAGVAFLAERSDVQPGRIGVLGLSMGGEEAIGAAAGVPGIAAVVAEGVSGRTAADLGWLPDHPGRLVNLAIAWVRDRTAVLLSDADPPTPLRVAVQQAAPRPVLLIAARGGLADEARPARWLQAASPGTVTVWEVPDAGHTQGLAADEHEWETRVVDFLDAALRR